MEQLVTVVTAVYNDEKYICKSVESILKQTFTDFEYIIVDDGSTDNTLNIINEIAKKDKRLIVISQNNLGAAAARNTAIGLAKGIYVAIQDSDDISSSDRLAKQVDQLRQSNGLLISCTGYNIINEEDTIITSNNKVYKNINNNILKGRFGACHPSMMFPKKLILEAGGYNTFYDKTEDYDLILRLLENKAYIEKINECLYNYRVRENSEGSMNNGAYTKRVFENHLNRIHNKPENFTKVSNNFRKDKNYLVKRRARDLFYSENYSEYIGLYLKVFYKLPLSNYSLYFIFSLCPNPIKRLLKSFAS